MLNENLKAAYNEIMEKGYFGIRNEFVEFGFAMEILDINEAEVIIDGTSYNYINGMLIGYDTKNLKSEKTGNNVIKFKIDFDLEIVSFDNGGVARFEKDKECFVYRGITIELNQDVEKYMTHIFSETFEDNTYEV